MINFSILITTRNRVQMLDNLLKSIYEHTLDKSATEIHVIYDNDDYVTDGFVKTEFSLRYNNQFPVTTYFHTRDRSPNLVGDYHNYYSKNCAKGKYIMFVNDDAIFELNGWDVKAMKKLDAYEEKHPDGILYGIPEDFEHEPKRRDHNWMACFPLVSKKVIDVLGYAFDPEFKRDGADWALAATYYSIDRVINLRDCIIIKHLSFRSGRRVKDELDYYSRTVETTSPSADSFIERNRKILLEYINNYSIKEGKK